MNIPTTTTTEKQLQDITEGFKAYSDNTTLIEWQTALQKLFHTLKQNCDSEQPVTRKTVCNYLLTKGTPTVTEYIAIEKDWNNRNIKISTVGKKERLYLKGLIDALFILTGLTSHELSIIRKCREFDISFPIYNYTNLLAKQKREREPFTSILNNKISNKF